MQNNVTNFSEEDFYVMVHTFQVSVGDNLEWRKTQPKKKYANKQWQNGDRFYYVINPNKFCSELHTFEAFLRVKKAIFEELQLEDYQLNRIDISINCKFEYEELYKLNLYFNSLDAVRCDAQNHYLVIGTDLDKRSIKFATKYYANEIYDKSIESQNRDNAKTRIEMRYKPRTNMDFETAVQETI